MACTCGQCTSTVKVCTQTTTVIVDDSVPSCTEFPKTDCVIHEAAIAYLSLPADSTLTDIIASLITSLADARVRITTLEAYNVSNP